MLIRMKTIIFLAVTVLFIAGIYFTPEILSFIRWQLVSREAKAVATSFPMQFGLTNTTIIPCVPVPPLMA